MLAKSLTLESLRISNALRYKAIGWLVIIIHMLAENCDWSSIAVFM